MLRKRDHRQHRRDHCKSHPQRGDPRDEQSAPYRSRDETRDRKTHGRDAIC
jgi:hypothetical protein